MIGKLVSVSLIMFLGLLLTPGCSEARTWSPFYQPNRPYANKLSLTPPKFISESNLGNQDFLNSVVYLSLPFGKIGTGVYLGNNEVATCAHVVRDMTIGVEFTNSVDQARSLFPHNFDLYKGAYIARQPKYTEDDLQFLRTNDASFESALRLNDWSVLNLPQSSVFFPNAHPLQILTPNAGLEGSVVWVLGFPYGDQEKIQVSAGVLRKAPSGALYVSDIQLQGGFSGGPVVTSDGVVIGLINTFFAEKGNATMTHPE